VSEKMVSLADRRIRSAGFGARICISVACLKGELADAAAMKVALRHAIERGPQLCKAESSALPDGYLSRGAIAQ
jgi:hypothetical protein